MTDTPEARPFEGHPGQGAASSASSASVAAGLYIHVPFCLTRCHYCDFASEATDGVPADFVEVLIREAAHYGARRDSFPAMDTIYVGGGTPSRLPPAAVRALLQGLRERLPLGRTEEVTFEVNPDDVTPAFLDALGDAGVTRVSLGVQSLHDEELSWLGRRHDAARAREALRQVQRAGFTLSVDLMFGLPGTRASRWEAVLREILDERPQHISAYQLTVEPDTPLGRRQAAGEPVLAPEEALRDLFLATSESLCEAGYEHYEISSFARGPEHRSRHNQKYWHHEPYLGLGPAAHSYRGRRRWWNHRRWDTYRASVSRLGHGVSAGECLRDEQLRLERLLVGMRLSDGLPVHFLTGLQAGYLSLLALEKQGLLAVKGGRAAPTLSGLLVADRLPLSFATTTARGR